MKKFNIIIIIAALLVACTAKRNIVKEDIKLSEEKFYSVFTDATKYALLGNLKNALHLYKLCIQEFPEKAAPYYQVSNIYLSVNDLESAKYYARKAAELDENNKWYLLNLASIYQKEKNIDSLIITYEKVVKISDAPEHKYNLALFYSTNGQYQKSMELTKKLEKEHSEAKEIYLIKHRNYAGMEYKDSAIAELEDLIRVFPDQFEHYGMLAEYLSEINEFSESKKVYMQLLERESENGLANMSYGDFFLKQENIDSALFYYKRGFKAEDISLEEKISILYSYIYEPGIVENDSVFVIELARTLADEYEDYRPYALMAEYYIKTRKYESAVEGLKNAIDLGATNYILWEQFIMIANFTEMHDYVKSYYAKAIELFPDEINLFIFSGYSLYVLEEYDSIISLEEKGLAITQYELDQRVQFMNILADAYRELGRLETSDSIYEEILIIDPNNLLIRNNYSYYLSVRGKQLERAEELSRLSIKKEPKNPTYLDTYGWILYKQGKTKEALKYIEAAIKNGAYNNGEVLDHYGDIMRDLLRCSEAVEAWEEALKYDEKLGKSITKKIESVKQDECYER